MKMSGKRKLHEKMMIKGINYRPTCQADILYWIMRFEEITLKRINTLSYLNLKKKKKKNLSGFRLEMRPTEELIWKINVRRN